MSNLNNTIEYINDRAAFAPEDFIAECETRYQHIIEDIAAKVSGDFGREVIMLAGPSSSGKTTTANMLAAALSKKGVQTYRISLDDFYLNRDEIPRDADGEQDFETVYALDLPLLESTLKELLNGETAKIPTFDFLTGKRSDKTTEITLGEGDAIIVEGLHALNPIITDALPAAQLLKIYISVSSRIYTESGKIVMNKRTLRFVRRMIRDYNFRGSSVANTYTLWQNVKAGEDKYLFPYRDNADIRINSVHLYAPCVFKDTALKLLKEADLTGEAAQSAAMLIRALEQFRSIDKKLLPSDSLLHEFLG